MRDKAIFVCFFFATLVWYASAATFYLKSGSGATGMDSYSLFTATSNPTVGTVSCNIDGTALNGASCFFTSPGGGTFASGDIISLNGTRAANITINNLPADVTLNLTQPSGKDYYVYITSPSSGSVPAAFRTTNTQVLLQSAGTAIVNYLWSPPNVYVNATLRDNQLSGIVEGSTNYFRTFNWTGTLSSFTFVTTAKGDNIVLNLGSSNLIDSFALSTIAGADAITVTNLNVGSCSLSLGDGDNSLVASTITSACSISGGTGVDTILISNIQTSSAVSVSVGSNSNTVKIAALGPNGDLSITAGLNDDLIVLGTTSSSCKTALPVNCDSGTMTTMQGTITLDAGGGRDTLFVTDRACTTTRSAISVSGNIITGLPDGTTITMSNFEEIDIFLCANNPGSGNVQNDVTLANPSQSGALDLVFQGPTVIAASTIFDVQSTPSNTTLKFVSYASGDKLFINDARLVNGFVNVDRSSAGGSTATEIFIDDSERQVDTPTGISTTISSQLTTGVIAAGFKLVGSSAKVTIYLANSTNAIHTCTFQQNQAEFVVYGGPNGDTFNVEANQGIITLYALDGNDTIILGGSSVYGGLTAIEKDFRVNGGGDYDALILDDTGGSGATGLIANTTITRDGFSQAVITILDDSDIEELQVLGGTGGISYGWAISSPAATTTTIRGGDGDDTFELLDCSNTILLHGDAGSDSISIGFSQARCANGETLVGAGYNVIGTISVDGGSGSDSLSVVDLGRTSSTYEVLYSNLTSTVLWGATGNRSRDDMVVYSNFESIKVTLTDGQSLPSCTTKRAFGTQGKRPRSISSSIDHEFDLYGSPTGCSAHIVAGNGQDEVRVWQAGGDVTIEGGPEDDLIVLWAAEDIAGNVLVKGGANSGLVNDSNFDQLDIVNTDTVGRNVTISGDTITGLLGSASNTVTFSDGASDIVEVVAIELVGSYLDVVTIDKLIAEELVVDTFGGEDTITVDLNAERSYDVELTLQTGGDDDVVTIKNTNATLAPTNTQRVEVVPGLNVYRDNIMVEPSIIGADIWLYTDMGKVNMYIAGGTDSTTQVVSYNGTDFILVGSDLSAFSNSIVTIYATNTAGSITVKADNVNGVDANAKLQGSYFTYPETNSELTVVLNTTLGGDIDRFEYHFHDCCATQNTYTFTVSAPPPAIPNTIAVYRKDPCGVVSASGGITVEDHQTSCPTAT